MRILLVAAAATHSWTLNFVSVVDSISFLLFGISSLVHEQSHSFIFVPRNACKLVVAIDAKQYAVYVNLC